ncbi:MAG: hypothetical protein WCX75_00070 [Fibrobacteraceae bacterium]
MNMNILQQNDSKGYSMFRTTLISLLAISAFASASALVENQDKIDSTVEAIESRRGIDIGGTVRAVYDNSTVSSDQDVNAINVMPDREMDEFVQLDLDMTFRPWDFVSANMILRLGAGMQDYFASSASTVNVQWLNAEGNIGKTFHWTVGDFRQQYSPLTLYMPGIDIMYEPLIFARNREMAQKDALLDGTQRNLQGANIQYRDYFGSTLGELRAEAFFARLRRVEALDTTGAEGNILPGEDIFGSSQASGFDKYAVAANIESYPLNRHLMVAGTYMYVWDDENSLTRTYFKNNLYESNYGSDVNYAYLYLPVNSLDSLPQATNIASVRLGADGAGILNSQNLILDLTTELAVSSDKVYKEISTYEYATDSLGAQSYVLLTDEDGVVYDTSKVVTALDDTDDGMAILANLNVGYKTDSWMIKASVDYIRNDSSWFNNLAQSSSFMATRVLNTDKDGNLTKYGAYSPLYSSFDALYYFTPKFTPASTVLKNDDNGMSNGQTDSYNIAPYSKNSWSSSVLTRKELALVDELSDANLQMALPNGLATANRTGFQLNLTMGYGKNNIAEVQGLFNKLEQISGVNSLAKASYSEYGGGAKMDILQLLGFNVPLELSGSYKHSLRELESADFDCDFINVGVYFRFFKRLGITAGFQKINSTLNASAAILQENSMSNLDVTVAPILDGEQMQWMIGLDYTLAPHAWLSVNYGRINVSNVYQTIGLVDADGSVSTTTNLPDYVVGHKAASNAATIKHEFSQNIIQATINVEF